MKKKLDLQDIKVESFVTGEQFAGGNDWSEITECTECDPTAFNPPTCNACPNTKTAACTGNTCGTGDPLCC